MIINTLAHLPLRRIGDRAEISKLLLTAWSFWWPALLQEPPRITLLEQKTLLSPRKFLRI